MMSVPSFPTAPSSSMVPVFVVQEFWDDLSYTIPDTDSRLLYDAWSNDAKAGTVPFRDGDWTFHCKIDFANRKVTYSPYYTKPLDVLLKWKDPIDAPPSMDLQDEPPSVQSLFHTEPPEV